MGVPGDVNTLCLQGIGPESKSFSSHLLFLHNCTISFVHVNMIKGQTHLPQIRFLSLY